MIGFRILPAVILTVLSVIRLGADDENATARAADVAWAGIEARVAATRPPESRPTSWIEFYSAFDANLRALQRAGLEFFERHPTDSRRWEAIYLILRHQPSFYAHFKPEFEQAPSSEHMEIDAAARDAWKARRAELIATIEAASDAPAKVKGWAAVNVLHAEYAKADAAARRAFVPKMIALAAQYPESDEVYTFIYRESTKLDRRDPPTADALWEGLLDSPHPRLRARAEGRQAMATRATTPVELRFTAIDGREVDLAAMRGKVVLIDFWAMWCGPCVEEIPNLRRVYEQYHDKGFEVVGISLDNPNLGDRLLRFLEAHDMPRPQHYDGLRWETPLAVRFSIDALPAMLLLDQEGRIVSIEARGDALEALVRKHLGL